MEDEEIRTDMIPFGKDDCMTDRWEDIMMMQTMSAPMMPVSQTLLVKLIDCIARDWIYAKKNEIDSIMNDDYVLRKIGRQLDVLTEASPMNTKEQFNKDKKGSWWDYHDGYYNTFMEIMTGER